MDSKREIRARLQERRINNGFKSHMVIMVSERSNAGGGNVTI